MQLNLDAIENIITTISPPFITLILGYYLGKRNWKKQFYLESFPLHEEVLKKLTSISDDEIEGFYFEKTEREMKKILRNKKVMSVSEYFSEMKKSGFINGASDRFPPNLAFGSIENMINDLNKLANRSNKKISRILKEILKIYNDENEKVEFYFDNLDSDGDNISKENSGYPDYLKRASEELILLKIVPLVNNLKIELNAYLKNKE